MECLRRVPDPEIPVLSVVDLGLIRQVSWEGPVCVVTITPTYSGCPAMQEISTDIKNILHARGVDQVRIETQLSPAWTTDWMTPEGRSALKDYGIAPPGEKAIDISGITRRATDVLVACPLCGSSHTRLISHFGSTSCKALYRCNDCGEPFDYFKAH
ncbi:phenylacetate-CoA oxygenase subunit PaaJ [Candidimonas sp. SYP-B2681]|uniref:1,2-phenylacetyl-CoA epoxidase subunit PaaD n=1 Tax=Candidimonas sp. SYP-B2681 TaxID=2497686 RepID=UPI000F88C588|nr:1,2-phenylacetyl-CoA epoxidase subunit PaaD [Candidimonas sp. SYP-B2681]RTZ41153.1 phenylacetate-CoA oxygenase subunit PaaJ [Candidimonas sp. SYP-B2681]